MGFEPIGEGVNLSPAKKKTQIQSPPPGNGFKCHVVHYYNL
jgi:hypothetical protein